MSVLCEQIAERMPHAEPIVVEVPRGTEFRRNARHAVLVVRSGLIVVFLYGMQGDRVALGTFGPQAVLGEIAALLTGSGEALTDSCFALSGASLCSIPVEAFRSLVPNSTAALTAVVKASAANQSFLSRQAWVLQGSRVIDRVRRLLIVCSQKGSEVSSFGDTYLNVSHEGIAIAVHAERASVSRALEKLEERGGVALKPNRIIISARYWESSKEEADHLFDFKVQHTPPPARCARLSSRRTCERLIARSRRVETGVRRHGASAHDTVRSHLG